MSRLISGLIFSKSIVLETENAVDFEDNSIQESVLCYICVTLPSDM